MAAKRGASSDLNHDNWDHDEEPEESGTFQRASDDSIKRRVIKTARRRNPISSVRDNGEESDKKSAFTSFSGFGKTPQPTTSAFSFLSNLANPKSPPKVNGIENKSTTKSSDITTFKFNSNPVTSANPTDKSSDTKLSWTTQSEQINTNIFTGTSNPNNNPSNTDEQPNDYYSKLKGLNQSVSNWIKKHVDTNPFINLQPIFKDYETYFNELEKEKDLKPDTSKADKSKNAVSSMGTFLFNPTANIPDSTTEKTQQVQVSKKNEEVVQKAEKTETVVPKFSFGSSTGNVSTTPSFSFGSTKSAGTGLFSLGTTTTDSTKTTTTTSSFTFGVKPTTTTTTGLTSFNSTTPFTFSNVAKPASAGDQKKEADDDEEPPQNDFTPVVEKDHVYTARCKVFVKKDDKFGDRGVGNLYLKPIENSEKVQLIVRADTNLGNLLLNLILSDTIPVKRLGKKDVMLVCVPTPEAAPPPVPVLLRVKNGDEADELLGTLEKHKK